MKFYDLPRMPVLFKKKLEKNVKENKNSKELKLEDKYSLIYFFMLVVERNTSITDCTCFLQAEVIRTNNNIIAYNAYFSLIKSINFLKVA